MRGGEAGSGAGQRGEVEGPRDRGEMEGQRERLKDSGRDEETDGELER